MIPVLSAGCGGGDDTAESEPAAAASTEAMGEMDAAADAMAVLLNPNLAGEDELTAVPGITAEVAAAVVGGRPYLRAADLHAALAEAVGDEAALAAYGALWLPINLNDVTNDEILLIPGVGDRMAHEFEEYRPYVDMGRAWSAGPASEGVGEDAARNSDPDLRAAPPASQGRRAHPGRRHRRRALVGVVRRRHARTPCAAVPALRAHGGVLGAGGAVVGRTLLAGGRADGVDRPLAGGAPAATLRQAPPGAAHQWDGFRRSPPPLMRSSQSANRLSGVPAIHRHTRLHRWR